MVTTVFASTLLANVSVSEATSSEQVVHNDMVQLDVSELQEYDFFYNGEKIDSVFSTAPAVYVIQEHKEIRVEGVASQKPFNVLKRSIGITSSDIVTNSNEDKTNIESATNSNDDRTTTDTHQNSPSKVESLINNAKSFIGTPYVWGGTTPKGFDSSGFIIYVFKQNGLTLPRTHSEYWHLGTPVNNRQKGDVVFFETYKQGPSHAGIYLGDGKFIHNSSTQGVIITRMDNSYWSPRYIGTKRFQ